MHTYLLNVLDQCLKQLRAQFQILNNTNFVSPFLDMYTRTLKLLQFFTFLLQNFYQLQKSVKSKPLNIKMLPKCPKCSLCAYSVALESFGHKKFPAALHFLTISRMAMGVLQATILFYSPFYIYFYTHTITLPQLLLHRQSCVLKTVNGTTLCSKCRKPALPCTLINVQPTQSYKIYVNLPMHLTAGCEFSLSCCHNLCIILSFSIND